MLEPVVRSVLPVLTRWLPARGNVLEILSNALGSERDFLVADAAMGDSVYAKAVSRSGLDHKFVKIVPRRHGRSLARGDVIARCASRRGILTPLREELLRLADRREMFIYPLIEGTPVVPGPESLTRLARALSELHGALRNCAASDLVSKRQQTVRRMYRRYAANLLADATWARDLPEARADVYRWLEEDRLLEGAKVQVIHNDLNPGNILVDRVGRIWFLDFEEAAWSYLPVEFDIARVVERYIVDGAVGADKKNAADSFVAAYRERDVYDRYRGGITGALRWLLGFSWLRLGPILSRADVLQHGEVLKFLHLGKLLDEHESWLREL